jgi:hypothetical protein
MSKRTEILQAWQVRIDHSLATGTPAPSGTDFALTARGIDIHLPPTRDDFYGERIFAALDAGRSLEEAFNYAYLAQHVRIGDLRALVNAISPDFDDRPVVIAVNDWWHKCTVDLPLNEEDSADAGLVTLTFFPDLSDVGSFDTREI